MVPIDDRASVAQRLLWMIGHYRNADIGRLVCPLAIELRGPLGLAAVRKALLSLSVRHEGLRTRFSGRGTRLTQHVQPPGLLTVMVEPADGATVATILDSELAEPFDIAANAARVRLWRLGADHHLLCINLHHLVSDAWSVGVLFREFAVLYERGPAGLSTAPAAPYRTFIAGQREDLSGERLKGLVSYWSDELAGVRLPEIARGSAARATPGLVVRGRVGAETARRIKAFSAARGTTVFATAFAAFAWQLSAVCSQEDVAVASMFANRSDRRFVDTVGLLANMVLLRASVPAHDTFGGLVDAVHRTTLGALAHQQMPLQMLPSDLLPAGRRPDDVVFQMMPGISSQLRVGDLAMDMVLPTELGHRFAFEFALVPVGAEHWDTVLFCSVAGWDHAAGTAFVEEFTERIVRGITEPTIHLNRSLL